jgi:hypothetical protein
MRTSRSLLIVFLGLVLVFTVRGFVRAQTVDVQFFPETGHSVGGEFLRYYNSAADPQLVFGYPITEQMISRDGKTVQYFQRARFELGTDSSGAPQVHLTPIGQALYTPGQPQNVANPLACQFVNATGFPVCFQFLDFYRHHGGPDRFGIPISPMELHDGVLVQYFESARFEWRTEGFRGRVVPTDLGRIYFDVLAEDPAQRSPIPPQDAAINPVLALRVRAYVAKSITRTSGEQAVYVIVRNQTNRPVSNASGAATITLADGTKQAINFTTDARGVALIAFSFNHQIAGEMVPIEISVLYQNLSATTRTSFRIWF